MRQATAKLTPFLATKMWCLEIVKRTCDIFRADFNDASSKVCDDGVAIFGCRILTPGLRLMHLDVRAQGLPTLVLLVPTRKPKCLGPRGYEPRDDFSYLLTVWVVSFLILGHRDHGLGPRDQDTCWYRVGLRF